MNLNRIEGEQPRSGLAGLEQKLAELSREQKEVKVAIKSTQEGGTKSNRFTRFGFSLLRHLSGQLAADLFPLEQNIEHYCRIDDEIKSYARALHGQRDIQNTPSLNGYLQHEQNQTGRLSEITPALNSPRRIRKTLYEMEKTGEEPDKPKKKKTWSRPSITQLDPEDQKIERAKEEFARRQVILHTLNSETELDEESLEKVLSDIKCEIPPNVLGKAVDYLRFEDPRVLFERYGKRVKWGPFEGFHEFRRGSTGRILFRISEGATHIRLGSHYEIYGTGKFGDASRSL